MSGKERLHAAIANSRYEGRLSDGRLLCILFDVFLMNKGVFPDDEIYDPDEWLSSVDGEACWIEQEAPSSSE